MMPPFGMECHFAHQLSSVQCGQVQIYTDVATHKIPDRKSGAAYRYHQLALDDISPFHASVTQPP